LIPKTDLSLREFYAIEHFFTGADFTRTSSMPLIPLFTGYCLWMFKKGFQYMKWFK
jgi:hypothetical protein